MVAPCGCATLVDSTTEQDLVLGCASFGLGTVFDTDVSRRGRPRLATPSCLSDADDPLGCDAFFLVVGMIVGCDLTGNWIDS